MTKRSEIAASPPPAEQATCCVDHRQTPPLAVGDHLALDFLNTIAAPQGTPLEWIGSGHDLVSWMEKVGALESRDAQKILQSLPASELDRAAAEARQLREWFRGIVTRVKQSGRVALAATELKRLNEVLSHDASSAQLEPCAGGNGFELVTRPSWKSAYELLVPIAASMADLLSEAEVTLVKRCENPSCTLWFYDRTKAHRRRWCSQTLCGNRAKVAAFRVRKRLGG